MEKGLQGPPTPTQKTFWEPIALGHQEVGCKGVCHTLHVVQLHGKYIDAVYDCVLGTGGCITSLENFGFHFSMKNRTFQHMVPIFEFFLVILGIVGCGGQPTFPTYFVLLCMCTFAGNSDA